ncbi:MAG: putative photosynthetic complex assembly protein PuhE [Pseudomonadota bacterium]
MQAYLWPFLFTVFVWWFTTGVIIYLDGLARTTFKWTIAGMTMLLAVALFGIAEVAHLTTVWAAYLGFAFGLIAWGWQEVTFLTGAITGPRKTPCPADATGLKRVRYAIAAILWHELATLVVGAVILIMTWNQPNQIALWTYVILWVMRQSAKLNVFLGAVNLSVEFLPQHMRYLGSYFRHRPMNGLFPFSITFATLAAAALAHVALAAEAGGFVQTGFTMLTTLLALAILEHWFMVVPLPVTALWQWGLKSHKSTDEPADGLDERITTPAQ